MKAGSGIKCLLISVVFSFLAGCVSPSPLNFSVQVSPGKKKIDSELTGITVSYAKAKGGGSASPFRKERQEHFLLTLKTALQEALDRESLFVDRSANKVDLQVTVLSIFFRSGIDVMIQYEIVDRESGKAIWSHQIISQGTLDFHSKENIFNPAIRNNILKFLQEIEQADIRPLRRPVDNSGK
jgi:hypothetical protein